MLTRSQRLEVPSKQPENRSIVQPPVSASLPSRNHGFICAGVVAQLLQLSVVKTWSGPNSFENLDGLAHSLKGVVNGSDGRLPRRKLGFEKRQVGLIRQRIADLVWLLSRPFGTSYAGDIMAVNLKNLDFSLLSEFLVGAGSTATDGERKAITARFADIKGSMDLMEDQR